MTDQQLYIDGQLVDTDEQTKITLNIKSNLLRDVSKMASNSTFTVKLPKTVRNQRIFEHADIVQSATDFQYKTHDARYLRNGVEIISYGRAVLLAATDCFEITILWGLFPNLTELISAGTTLNQLQSDARIIWSNEQQPDDYASAKDKDYFYCGLNMILAKEVTTYWKSGYTNTTPTSSGSIGGHSSTGGTSFIHSSSSANKTYLHPCVKVSWILELIKSNLNIDFKWVGAAKEYIDELVIPLISRQANDLTFLEKMQAQIPAKSGTTLGDITLNVSSNIAVFQETTGAVAQLTVKSDVTLRVNIAATAKYNMNGYTHKGTKGWAYNGCFVTMIVTKADGNVIHYNAGDKRGTETGFRRANFEDFPSNIITDKITGEGVIKFEQGDKITFAAYYCQWNGFGNGTYYGKTTPSSYHPNTTFEGGTVEIGVVSSDGKIPTGGYFPIAYNLPKIKIIDFVKFLAVITGTFPLQSQSTNRIVEFLPLATVWDNVSKAVDWTRRIVPNWAENKPKELTYKLSDYAQNNWYKWKKDDTVVGNYDGNLVVEDGTLEVEKTIFEFPFAATDGNYVPCYEVKQATSSGESNEPSYKACKDRILRFYGDDNGKAQATFDINMQDILVEKYAELSRTLNGAKVIKERVRISNVELLQFDETLPVYLAQYGSYFAITEIKGGDNVYADVTMIQLML